MVVHDAAATAVIGVPGYEPSIGRPIWRCAPALALGAQPVAAFDPPPPQLTFARRLTTARYDLSGASLAGLPRVLWHGIASPGLGREAIRTATGFFPDAGDTLYADRDNLLPGRDYTLRLAWNRFGSTDTTAAFGFRTPSGPLDVAVAVDSIVGSGEGVITEWHLAPADSLQGFAPVFLDFRLDGGAWSPGLDFLFPDANGRLRAVHPLLAVGRALEYRIRWVSPLGERTSAPVRFAWIDAPELLGITASPDSFVVRYRVPLRSNLRVQLHGIGPAGASRLLGESAADDAGDLRIVVRPVSPDTLYRLQSTWVNGGVTRFSAPFQYVSGTPPGPAPASLSLAVHGGAGSDPLLRVGVPAGQAARLALHDLSGRIVWTVPLGEGTRDIRLELGSSPSGLYFARVTAPAGTATARVVIVR